MFRKEGSFKYFLGGTVVGVTAGLMAGKILSTTEIHVSGATDNRNTKKRSQDDNIYSSLYVEKNQHNYPRSKSTSRYERTNLENAVSPAAPRKERFASNDNENPNNFSAKKKTCLKENNVSHSRAEFLYNISVEDNNCNTLDKSEYAQKGEKNFSSPVFKRNNIDKQDEIDSVYNDQLVVEDSDLNNFARAQSKTIAKKVNIEHKNINLVENVIDSKISKSIPISKVLNSSSAFCADESDVASSFNVIQSSVLGSRMLNTNVTNVISDIENSTNITTSATCNTIRNVEDDVKEDDRILNFTTLEEFQEADVISSTALNNLE